MTKTFAAVALPLLVLSSIGLYYHARGRGITHVFIIDDVPSQHHYRSDGLLVVNPAAKHPIPGLIARSEAAWKRKLSRASKSLEAAVVEYRRRYGRAPPPGFDAWWKYVQAHNVQLPDEYDQIYRDLEPFWGMDVKELQSLVSQEEKHSIDTYTLGKYANSSFGLLTSVPPDSSHDSWGNVLRGADDVIKLVKDIEHDLPPFQAVFSPLDNPMLVSEYALKSRLLEAASNKTTLRFADYPPISPPGYLYSSACPPGSPALNPPIDLDHPPPAPPQSQKTFIADHRLTMDPCLHPSLFYSHGEFVANVLGPLPEPIMRPRFTPCSTMVHHDVQIPTFLSWVDDLSPSDNPEWDHKSEERLTWRGSNTALWFSNTTRWNVTQRVRLINLANDLNGTVSVLLPSDDSHPVGSGTEIAKSILNPALFDIFFAGGPLQCTPDTCEKLSHLFDWHPWRSRAEAGRFKYIFDIDGNAWSSRFKRLITSKSLIFKATIYPEWFLDRIQPWVHYVPIQMDLSDLHDAFIFFHGGPSGEGAHDALAKKIAYAGREWSKAFWRPEDMTAYTFRLFLEYARVMSSDRDKLNFELS